MRFMPKRLLSPIAVLIPALATCAWAGTSEVTSASFLSSFHEELDATPEQAWQALVHIGGWWSAAHTYSGNAANLSLEPAAGGCWCERWGNNSVQHARVLVAMPGRLLRVDGALGPLQAMGASGVLTFRLSPREQGRTALDVSYQVRATPDAALDKVAPAVDHVLDEQVKRLVAAAKQASSAPASGM